VPKKKRVVRKKRTITSVRCLWCGRRKKVKKAKVRGRIAVVIVTHKAPVPWEMRDDDLCPGSGVKLTDFASWRYRMKPKYQ
jgi:hypothetical protein